MEDGGGLSASARVDLSALALGVALIPGVCAEAGRGTDSLGVGGFGFGCGRLLLRDGSRLRVALKRLTRLDSRFDDAQDSEVTILREVGASCGAIDHVNALRCFGGGAGLGCGRRAAGAAWRWSAAPDRSLRRSHS